jgi:thioredoxin reductase/bacterioferritin-associated ferredoxin
VKRFVAVVGAGPAGLSAAIEAARSGAQVTLLDEAARPGGQIYRQAHPSLGDGEYAEVGERARKHALFARFQEVASGIDYRSDANVYGLFANGELHFAQDDRSEVLRPDAIVLATGVREMAIPFPGWTTPGVMLAGGAQAILKSQRVLPGRQVVIAGCGPLPVVVAAQLIRAGGEVRALAGLRPLREMTRDPLALWHGRTIVQEGFRYTQTVARAGVESLTGFVPIRAIGEERLEAVVLARADREGCVVAGTEREIGCDLLGVNYGFAANSELAAMAGASMRFDAERGGWVPVTDAFGRTSVSNVFVAGDGAGVRGALVAEAEGQIVGAAAAARPYDIGTETMRTSLTEVLRRRVRHQAFQSAVRMTLRLPPKLWQITTDDTVVCRCENVTLRDIRTALAAGHSSINAVKRNVRSGMGWCGGRTCLRAVAALTELYAGVPPAAMMTPRPMVRPVTFGAVAAQSRAQSKAHSA